MRWFAISIYEGEIGVSSCEAENYYDAEFELDNTYVKLILNEKQMIPLIKHSLKYIPKLKQLLLL